MRKLMQMGLAVVVATVFQAHATWAGPGNTVTLALSPSTSNATVGQNFMVTIQVQSGVQLVDGAAAYLNFDPTILQVVSIQAGSSLPVPIQSQFNNTLGTLDFAAGTFSSFPSGTFTLAVVTFSPTTTTAGTTLAFNLTPPRQSDVTFGGHSVLTTLPQSGTVIVTAPTATPSPTATLTKVGGQAPASNLFMAAYKQKAALFVSPMPLTPIPTPSTFIAVKTW